MSKRERLALAALLLAIPAEAAWLTYLAVRFSRWAPRIVFAGGLR